MTAKELIANLRSLGTLDGHVIFNYLAEHTYEAKLATGQQLRDASDFKAFLRELAEEAKIPGPSHFRRSTEVSTAAGNGTGPKVLPPAPQRRYEDATCPRCGHVHEGDGECGVLIGGGRYCRCELEVPA